VSADPSMVSSIFFGLFESAEIRFVRRYVASDLDCLELGSGIGLVSRAIAETLQPGRLLVCVEPRADLLVCAKENIRSVAQRLRCRYIPALVDRMERSDAGFPILADWINARMSGVGGPTSGRLL
jgi:ubiquinone/menaquinone biosynthesis C-methylase UbiE